MKSTIYYLCLALLCTSIIASEKVLHLSDFIIQSNYQQVEDILKKSKFKAEEQDALIALSEDIVATNRKNLDYDWIKVYFSKELFVTAFLFNYFVNAKNQLLKTAACMPDKSCFFDDVKYALYVSGIGITFFNLFKLVFLGSSSAYNDLHKKVEDAQKIKYLLIKNFS